VARERDAHSETRDTVVAAPFPRTTTSRSRASPASLDRGARLHWPSVRVDLYHVTPCRSCSRPVRATNNSWGDASASSYVPRTPARMHRTRALPRCAHTRAPMGSTHGAERAGAGCPEREPSAMLPAVSAALAERSRGGQSVPRASAHGANARRATSQRARWRLRVMARALGVELRT